MLYATTAGIAANKPSAVANNASAIPGATIAKLVFLEIAIDWNEFIIPQTVPNNPTKGAVDPIVARYVKFFSTVFNWSLIEASRTLSTLVLWTAEDLDLVLINSDIADLKTIVSDLKAILEEIDKLSSHDGKVLDFVKDIVPVK